MAEKKKEDAFLEGISKEELIKYLDKKWLGSKKCPICQENNWSLARNFIELTAIETKPPFKREPGAIMPALVLACTNCGYINLFNPLEVDLFQEKFKDSKHGYMSTLGRKITTKEGKESS